MSDYAAAMTRPGVVNRARTLLKEPVLVVLVVLVVVFSVSNETFATVPNWTDLAISYFPELALLTIASALVLLIRGIDLSVAAVSALTAVFTGEMYQAGSGIVLAVVLGLVVAVLAGTLNGLLIVYARVSPIVTTLATLQLYRGISLGVTNGLDVSGFPESFTFIGQGFIAGQPAQMATVIIVAVLVIVVLRRSMLGRWIYALGGNPRAARLSGVPTRRLTIGVYAAASLIAGIAGLITAARLGATRADMNSGAELDAITAAILGGISIAGGRGKILWALAGALTIGVLRNGLTLLNQTGYVQIVAVGLVLIFAVLMQKVTTRRTLRREIRAQLDAPRSDDLGAASRNVPQDTEPSGIPVGR